MHVTSKFSLGPQLTFILQQLELLDQREYDNTRIVHWIGCLYWECVFLLLIKNYNLNSSRLLKAFIRPPATRIWLKLRSSLYYCVLGTLSHPWNMCQVPFVYFKIMLKNQCMVNKKPYCLATSHLSIIDTCATNISSYSLFSE